MLSSKYLDSETITKCVSFLNVSPCFSPCIILQNLFRALMYFKAINLFLLYFLKPTYVWTGPLIWCMKLFVGFYGQQLYPLQGSVSEEATGLVKLKIN